MVNMKRAERIDRVELMHTFVRIVEAGSLSHAARLLGTTQATISRRLQSLESLLGTKLLLRTTHAMKLTDDGERCYQHAKRLIDAWVTLEDELNQAGDEPVGWMLNDKTVNFLSDNIDCAIRVGAEVDPATVSVLLAEVPRCIVAAPSLLTGTRIDTPQQLATLPWVALSLFYQHEVVVSSQGATERVAIAPRLYTDSLYVARNTALAGLGVTMISSWTVEEDIRQGRLVQLLPDWQPAPLPVHLVYPWARYYPARLRAFLQLMREVMPGLTGMQQPGKQA